MRKIATVVGLGISGLGAARLLKKKGWDVRVTEAADTPEVKERIKALDKIGGIKFETGAHTKDFISGSEVVVTGPGVKDNAAPLVWARQLGIPVIDEIELGYRFCPAKIVAVTGTNGKSTTVTLIGEVLKRGGRNAVVCGNIGLSFCDEVLKLDKDDIVVLEVSSFQLQRVVKFRPYVSLFLNITQNHLDRHKDFKEYLDAKLNIFKNQKGADWAIVNYDDKRLKHLKRHIRPRVLYFGNSIQGDGAVLEKEKVYLFSDKKMQEFICASETALKGEHNLKNIMAVILAGNIFKIKPQVIRDALKKFRGLEHRCEFIDEVDNVRFVNDSKATTVDAAMHAIRSIDSPVILIAGGRDKGSDFTVLKDIAEQKVKAIVLIGEAKQKIRTQLMGSAPMYDARDLKHAVDISLNLAEEKDTVLLSPMCASFDMFKNFEDRGECFKKAVKSVKTQLCRIQ